jgi:hypothetical protein
MHTHHSAATMQRYMERMHRHLADAAQTPTGLLCEKQLPAAETAAERRCLRAEGCMAPQGCQRPTSAGLITTALEIACRVPVAIPRSGANSSALQYGAARTQVHNILLQDWQNCCNTKLHQILALALWYASEANANNMQLELGIHQMVPTKCWRAILCWSAGDNSTQMYQVHSRTAGNSHLSRAQGTTNSTPHTAS